MKKLCPLFILLSIFILYNNCFAQESNFSDRQLENQLLGSWQTITGDAEQIQFSIFDGLYDYTTFLYDRPFTSGTWKVENGRLIIEFDYEEEPIIYIKVVIKENTLYLTDQHGNQEKYQRMGDDSNQMELFHETIINGDYDTVNEFLKNGIDVDIRAVEYIDDSEFPGLTGLMIAIQQGQVEIMELLIENGADVNAEAIIMHSPMLVIQYSPLTCAVDLANLDVIKYLLTKGAKSLIDDALFAAVNQGNIEITQILLDNGGHVNAVVADSADFLEHTYMEDMPLIIRAVANNDIDMVRFLLARGADPHSECSGITALDIAAQNNNMDIYNLLQQAQRL